MFVNIALENRSIYYEISFRSHQNYEAQDDQLFKFIYENKTDKFVVDHHMVFSFINSGK